jgi:hypothetical protein
MQMPHHIFFSVITSPETIPGSGFPDVEHTGNQDTFQKNRFTL